jgi:hypothetical protein
LNQSSPLLPLGLSAIVAGVLVGFGVIVSLGAQPAEAQGKPVSPQVLDTSSPFSHDHHMDPKTVGKALTCAGCHEMVEATGKCPKGDVRFPKHEACAGCHTPNFYTPQKVNGVLTLTICQNCHKNAQFSKSNPLKELTRLVTPRKAEFSHQKHDGTACTECHALQRGGESVAHPSHPNCCQCHSDGSVQPRMGDCAACHAASLNAGRPRSKIHSFSHKSHNIDTRNGRSMDCVQCHVNTAAATSLRTIAAPPMSSCVQCHDGSDPNQAHPTIPGVNGSGAFHFTACLRCHTAGSIRGVALPAGHPTDTATSPGAAP